MKPNDYQKFKAKMTIRGLNFDWQRMNCVRMHGTEETLKHWLLKCLAARVVKNAGHVVLTEFELPNKGEIDVYDATDNVAIEIETKRNEKTASLKLLKYTAYVRDMFILYVDDFSDDPWEAEKQIRIRLGL